MARVCWFRSSCRHKDSFCPFQHPRERGRLGNNHRPPMRNAPVLPQDRPSKEAQGGRERTGQSTKVSGRGEERPGPGSRPQQTEGRRGVIVKRACRFGSACRFKNQHCPFQHPGESREQGYRQDTTGKYRDPEASRVGKDTGWQNVGGRWGWRGQAVEKDRATKPTQGVRRTVAEEPGGGRPTQGPPRPEVAAPAQHLGRGGRAREDGRGAQGGRREDRTFPEKINRCQMQEVCALAL